MPSFRKWYLPLVFSTQNYKCISCLSNAWYIALPTRHKVSCPRALTKHQAM